METDREYDECMAHREHILGSDNQLTEEQEAELYHESLYRAERGDE